MVFFVYIYGSKSRARRVKQKCLLQLFLHKEKISKCPNVFLEFLFWNSGGVLVRMERVKEERQTVCSCIILMSSGGEKNRNEEKVVRERRAAYYVNEFSNVCGR